MSTPPAQTGRRPLWLLIVTYYFPPSGGAGVQRVLKWVKYLPQYGVEPVVLTVRTGAFPQVDETLRAQVPAAVSVVRTRSFDPFALYGRLTGRSRAEAVAARTDVLGSDPSRRERLSRWLRANAFVPDARVGWVPFAAVRGLLYSRRNRVDALLSTGPPHSAHLVGWSLRNRLTPWVADFRDPWTDIHYYGELSRTGPAARLDASLERRVLRTADAVTTVSPSWARLLEQKRRAGVTVIPNGFDPEDFAGPLPGKPSDAFVVSHVGSLYASRDPHALWQAAARLRGAGKAPRLRVRVVGRVGEEVLAAAAEQGVPVESSGYVPHAEAVREMRAAHLLLLSTEPHAAEAGHITGKLYEYLASGTPVLALGDPHGDAAELVGSAVAGHTFARDDVAGVEQYLARAYREWERGETPRGADPEAVAPFSRARQAGRLAEELRVLIAGRDV